MWEDFQSLVFVLALHEAACLAADKAYIEEILDLYEKDFLLESVRKMPNLLFFPLSCFLGRKRVVSDGNMFDLQRLKPVFSL
jgi:hypothetical protein